MNNEIIDINNKYKYDITMIYNQQIIVWDSASVGNMCVGSYVEDTIRYIHSYPCNVDEINIKLEFIKKSL